MNNVTGYAASMALMALAMVCEQEYSEILAQ